MNNKKLSLELIRFLITGVICALADFLVCFIFKELLSGVLSGFLLTGVYTLLGFTVGVILNYLLSTYFVFKNVKDDKASKKTSFIVFFILLSAVGWLISWSTMEICTIASAAWFNVNIASSLFEEGFSFTILITLEFWLFIIAFGLKTLLGMVWNYLTRKFILYKAPKE